jgi:dGTPase
VREVRQMHPGLERSRAAGEVVRRQITVMVEDVVAETARRLQALKPASVEDVRRALDATITFSKAMAESETELKTWLYAHLYRHAAIMDKMRTAESVVEQLFDAYVNAPGEMSEGWREGMAEADEAGRARHVSDYISGMTDNFALSEHARLFDLPIELG